ncbi:MAG: mandelate racemase/muconate lactonizing enzyme family protein [Planctomycetia bacterium]|nr:mandelate racemase/muconate lactonizing enzyme family protein [Planctomycetia bacterium]
MNPSRREFFLTAAGAAGVATAADLSAQETAKPQAAVDSLRQKTGTKIVSIETFHQGTNVGFVRLRTDDGSEGVGQMSPFEADVTATLLHRKLAPLVLGADPGDFEAISDSCIEKNYKFPWSFICRGLAGIDTALWDLLGKKHQKSVCELLGGKPRPIGVYGSSMRRDIKPADEAQRLVKLRDDQGFQAFKVRVGKVTGHDEDQWPGRTDELIPTIRKAVGDQVRLQADANSCYTPKKAIEVGKVMEQHGYFFLEEPCPYWELEWTAQVAEALKMHVAGGEQDNDLAQWRRMIRMKAVDIVQPDIMYVGGLTRALRVARMAAEAKLPCTPHSANLSLVTVCTLHMMAAIPNAGYFVEFSIEDAGWTKDLFAPALVVKDGKVSVPAGPGWGVTVNPAWLEKATRQVSEKK